MPYLSNLNLYGLSLLKCRFRRKLGVSDLVLGGFGIALAGRFFVGVGVGLCVRMNSAPSGDDALAMGLSKVLNLGIQWVYLIGDITVLALSVTYIPIGKLAYSLITVILSGQIVGLFQKKDKSAA